MEDPGVGDLGMGMSAGTLTHYAESEFVRMSYVYERGFADLAHEEF